ncbi:DUF2961 domain-containing protein [Bradyrhizobium sp. 153]|uniref:DUF2961 domain-containing protein n=1 Tax=Bradyrhizobium sp. 153 TaxID=2782627 RepID=UPI001FFB1647|nr:DUF2961 domain-containing protein [Bradyrhizobium sp. 153]MCK1668615.1 DUF2961 domain-containing protein [Bradyrhizobium sp. 153]
MPPFSPTIVYRTTDPAQWGTGKGSPLLAEEADSNFYQLVQAIESVAALEPHEITSIDVTPEGVMTIHLDGGATFGPYTLPVASLTYRDQWAPDTTYFKNDYFTEGSGLYLVLQNHTSEGVFSPTSGNGLGLFYKLILAGASGGGIGSRWYTGSGAPSTITGQAEGDLYLDDTTGDVYEFASEWSLVMNIKGPSGPAGADGADGARGSLWYEGTGAPGTITGQADGDVYLDTASGDVYKRASGAWSLTGNIKGPQGDPGGPEGPAGADGARGSLWYNGSGAPGAIAGQADRDMYLDDASGDVYALASGVWGLVGNLKGPEGAPGGGGGGSGTADILSPDKKTGTIASQKKEYASVAGSATVTLVDYAGFGYVDTLLFAAQYSNGASLTGGTINIYIDGNSTPDISVGLDVFFQSLYMTGATAPNRYFQSKFFSVNTDGGNVMSYMSRLPIPFASHVKIEIVNGSSSAMTVWSTATIQTGVANDWPRTRRLHVDTILVNPAANATLMPVNVIGKGRLVGIWCLQDDFPNSLAPKGAAWEGNWRFYIDSATKKWKASTAFSAGDKIIDANGNLQTVATGGTTGGTTPTWNQAAGGTTTDGGVTWTQKPGAPNQVWRASAAFAANMSILDPNGNVQRVTTAGTSGASAPTWATSAGATTTDGGVTWTNQGSAYEVAKYQSSGGEDYFGFGFYGAGLDAMSSSNGEIGTGFCLASPMVATSQTRAFYRYHLADPITFDTSLVITWQVGDTSQVAWTAGGPRIWVTVYYYTET